MIEEEVEHIHLQSNQSQSDLYDVMKRTSSHDSNGLAGKALLGLTNEPSGLDQNINIDDLEEADLLAMPLSQRLRLRSLQSASSQASQTSENSKTEQTPKKTHIYSFSSDGEDDQKDDSVTAVASEIISKPEVNEDTYCSETYDDPFFDDGEIISGVLHTQSPAKGYVLEDIDIKISSQCNDFVNDMQNMSIGAEDDGPVLVDTLVCDDVTGTVCIDVNSTQATRNVNYNRCEETKVIDKTAAQTICIEVGDELTTCVKKDTTKVQSLCTTKYINGADTVCLEVGHETDEYKTKHFSHAETFHCKSPDLTKTQLICSDVILQCGYKRMQDKSAQLSQKSKCAAISFNVTRGCFDLETDFTLSETTKTTFKIPPSEEVTPVVISDGTELLNETKIIDLTCSSETDETLKLSNSHNVMHLEKSGNHSHTIKSNMTNQENEEPVLIVTDNTASPEYKATASKSSFEKSTLIVPNKSSVSEFSLLSDTSKCKVYAGRLVSESLVEDTFVANTSQVCVEEQTVCLNVENTSLKPSKLEMYAAETTTFVDVVSVDSFCEPEVQIMSGIKPDINKLDNPIKEQCEVSGSETFTTNLENPILLDSSCSEMMSA